MGHTANLGLTTGSGSDMFDYTTMLNGNMETLDELGRAYVTDCGVSGSWHWRRWSDGYAECWCSSTLNNVAVNIAWGSLWRSAEVGMQTLPIQFAERPHMTATWAPTNGQLAYVTPYSGLSTTSTGHFMLLRGESGTTSGVLSLHVSGRVS